VTGRAANAQNVESLEGLALVTRWRIGGGGLGVTDTAAPPEPAFAVNTLRDGTFELGGISFTTLENTQSIASGVWGLHYVDEVSPDPGLVLAAAVSDSDPSLTLNIAGPATAGDLVQIGLEVLEVTDSLSGGTQYEVARGSCGTAAAAHVAGEDVLHLKRRTETVSFRRNFFGSPENATWAHHAVLPNARLACSTLELSNVLGSSPIGYAPFTGLVGGGLRSHRGGQFTIQIEGVFGVLDDAAPVLSVQENVSIRDVFAIVKKAPLGSDIELLIRQDGAPVAAVSITDGATVSAPINGAALPYLVSGGALTLDILAVGSLYPGSDLTVTIRV
jgi:hypothetical protein